MKPKITSSIGAVLALVLFLAGCGSSVSAPPIDLPAPITGRIDVSSPDADGNVTVSGSEGAVTGGALVMVVNESGTAVLDILSRIVGTAYAADYPDICSEAGHACEYAADDGSFVVVIAAASEDPLTIGLIHADSGAWRSETIQVTVPTPAEPEANCAGKGLTGAVKDVAIAPVSGVPMLLKQGSDTTTNQIVIGASGDTTVDINGCYAHSIATKEFSGEDRIVVTSKEDKTIWMGKYKGGAFTDKRSFTMQNEPMHAMFIEPYVAPIVAMKTSNSVVLTFVSLIDGAILETMEIYSGASTVLTGITRSLSISSIENDEGKFIGVLLTDKGNPVNSYLTIFQADNLTHKKTWPRVDVEDGMESMVSAALFVEESDDYIMIAIADSAGLENNLHENIISVEISSSTTPLSTGNKLAQVTNWVAVPEVVQNSCAAGALQDIEVARSALGPLAAMSTDDGNLATIQLSGAVAACVIKPWAAGHVIPAIALDNVLNILFGADATAEIAIDGTSLLY